MLIRSPEDAERAACDWMRSVGWPEAHLTGGGADGGVDIRAAGCVAQVKAEMKPIGRPAVQMLFGIASNEGVKCLFFSLSGFTKEAQVWADNAGVATFTFDLQGDVTPTNQHSAAFRDASRLGIPEGRDRRSFREAKEERVRQAREAREEKARRAELAWATSARELVLPEVLSMLEGLRLLFRDLVPAGHPLGFKFKLREGASARHIPDLELYVRPRGYLPRRTSLYVPIPSGAWEQTVVFLVLSVSRDASSWFEDWRRRPGSASRRWECDRSTVLDAIDEAFSLLTAALKEFGLTLEDQYEWLRFDPIKFTELPIDLHQKWFKLA